MSCLAKAQRQENYVLSTVLLILVRATTEERRMYPKMEEALNYVFSQAPYMYQDGVKNVSVETLCALYGQ